MAIRWWVCPVVEEPHPDGGVIRYPKIARIIDPGTGLFYGFSAAIADGRPRAICFVRGQDFSALAADPECVDPFEALNYEDTQNMLAETPNTLGWSPARQSRLRTRLINWGVDGTGLTGDTPLWQILKRIMSTIHPVFQPQGTWVRA